MPKIILRIISIFLILFLSALTNYVAANAAALDGAGSSAVGAVMQTWIKTYNQDTKNYKVYNKLFYIRFISSLDIFLRLIYRLKVLFNNFQKK